MSVKMFMNEFSLTPAAIDVSSGKERLERFVLTIRAATMQGVCRTLYLPDNFSANKIAPSYYLKDWLLDKNVDCELRRFFTSLATKSPFLRYEEKLADTWAGIDCLWQNKKSLGLKAAYVADGLAISILSQPQWDNPYIQCEIQEIIDNNVCCRSTSIHHASSSTHIKVHVIWLQQSSQHSVENGTELWQRTEELFPALIFCFTVKNQMSKLSYQSLDSIIRGLSRLNTFCTEWRLGPFDHTKTQCSVSPESKSTLEKYRSEHTFLCPDGQKRLFSLHAKIGKLRIYFNYDLGPGSLLIGHIGEHLPTVRFSK